VSDSAGSGLVEAVRDLQERYWAPNQIERMGLLKRGIAALAWKERIRLLHLVMSELLVLEAGWPQLKENIGSGEDLPGGRRTEIARSLVESLRTSESPFRGRHASVWLRDGNGDVQPEPRQGVFENASVTHLGALELVQLDAARRPTALRFQAFDELHGILLGKPSPLRLAKLSFDDGRATETVLLPLLYGASWHSRREHDRDGSFTRYVCHLPGLLDAALGIGNQSFWILGSSRYLTTLSSIDEVVFSLSLDDPRFDARARARGLDPEALRRKQSGA
jgi:hypothetical protein